MDMRYGHSIVIHVSLCKYYVDMMLGIYVENLEVSHAYFFNNSLGYLISS
jgi:hypothetical protein